MGFGGRWTTEKLDILESYLNSYTTALKNQLFRLIYIDAFAGSGEINIGEYGVSDFDSDSFVTGSTERALSVQDRSFDQFVFVEKEADRYTQLLELKARHPDRLIDVKQDDANAFLSGLSKSSFRKGPNTQGYVDWRGVLFVGSVWHRTRMGYSQAHCRTPTARHVASLSGGGYRTDATSLQGSQRSAA